MEIFSNSTPLLQVKNFGLRRPKTEEWLWRGVSFTVAPQDRVVVAGPNGVGKSMLFRAIALLQPVDEGEILWQGGRVTDRQVPAYRGKVMYVPQRAKFSEGTVEENLEEPFGWKTHRGIRYSADLVLPHIEALGLSSDFLQLRTETLSGGEGQIASLLRAIILQPRVLLLDEPTAALSDPMVHKLERGLLDWVRGDAERALFVISHSEAPGKSIGSHRLMLEPGTWRWEAWP